MRKTRILYVSGITAVSDSHTLAFARALIRAGYDLKSAMPEGSTWKEWKNFPIPQPKHFFWLHGPGMWHLTLAMAGRLMNVLRLFNIIRRVSPDIIIALEPDAWCAAVLSQLWRGVTVVADVREIYEEKAAAFPRPLRRLAKAAIRGLLRALSGRTALVLHVSRARQLLHSYLKCRSVVVLYCADLNRAKVAEVGGATSKIRIIHAGALRRAYSGRSIVRAATDLAGTLQIEIVVPGGIATDMADDAELRALINSRVVIPIDTIPHEEIYELYSSSHVGLALVSPINLTHVYAQPRKLFEYMAAGLPVVATDSPTMRKIVVREGCGLVVAPDDHVALANAMRALASSPELRRQFGMKGRAAAERAYNWEAESRRLVGAIQSLRRDSNV